MSQSLSLEQIVEALYVAILNRQPDSGGLEGSLAQLRERPETLPDLVRMFVTSRERFDVEQHQPQVLRALYRGSLGREPDQQGLATYGPLLLGDFAKGVMSVADALHHSAEYQDRKLPLDLSAVLVDHSPHGESRIILRRLAQLGSQPRGTAVEVGVPNPARSVTLDIVKFLDWRAILIEGSGKAQVPIESRFAGSDYTLIQADLVDRDASLVPVGDDGQPDKSHSVRLGLGLIGETEKSDTPDGILQRLNVPTGVQLLTIARASNTLDIFNELVAAGRHMPELVVLMQPVTQPLSSLRDVGLSEAVAGRYDLLSTTSGSMLLERRRG